ncbi:hypothetical protein KGQ19_00440 [Catenulispora sp. NL8]|uniref:Uncharacterized protein n=1 Tax=Catenulispora pinistramenti TaxID=2705254 RepID=A0ABS5KGD7_9ACTN|nr:hypothetical protein [Catenulispora pinistramenti]MBS2545326.1 hypothetical protein [Catenulispora pinistramenti]
MIALRLGGTVSLIAIAVISFDVLTDLGRKAGLHQLAELFPIAVDAFAASTLYAAYRLPGGHPAREQAKRTARSALALTVCCNVLDHVLALAGFLLPVIIRDLVLVAVASLPQLVADRELHLLVAVTAHRQRRTPTDAAEPVQEPDASMDDAAGEQDVLTAREEAWLKIGAPVYQELLELHGRRPKEKAFHQALAQRLTVQTDDDAGLDDQPDPALILGNGVSLSTAKRIRALVESRHPPDEQAATSDESPEPQ